MYIFEIRFNKYNINKKSSSYTFIPYVHINTLIIFQKAGYRW